MTLNELVVPVSARDHVKGPLDAPVVLVEYGDFECPHCRRAYPIVKAAQLALGDDIAIVYRHFPLAEAHPHATLAAQASEAAGARRKFWAMHNMLFEHQDALEENDLLAYADALGLDRDQFARELESGAYAQKVHDDFRGGVRSGVNGTPTFFINGARFDGNWAVAGEFIAVLAQAAELGGHRVR